SMFHRGRITRYTVSHAFRKRQTAHEVVPPLREALEPVGRVGLLAQLPAEEEFAEDELQDVAGIGTQLGIGAKQMFRATILSGAETLAQLGAGGTELLLRIVSQGAFGQHWRILLTREKTTILPRPHSNRTPTSVR